MTTHPSAQASESRRARAAFLAVGVALPVALVAIGSAVIAAWLPTLPDPVVIHWGTTGADGFAAPTAYFWLLLAVGLVLPLALALTSFGASRGRWGATTRLMGGFAAGLSAFALTLCLGSLALQRGLADAADTPDVGLVLLLAFVVLAAGTVAGWAVQPRVIDEAAGLLEPRLAVRVADGERVVWLGTTTMPRAALLSMAGVTLLLAVLAAYMLAAGAAGGWVTAISVIVVGGALAVTSAFRVRITPSGFAARSLLGWPRAVIPIDRIVSARAVDISPFGDFGGWGWRIAVDGRTGIVMHRGAAIEIARRDRKPFIVTIDGAEEAAALLQAYAERHASDSEREAS